MSCAAAVLAYNNPRLVESVLSELEYKNAVLIDNGSLLPLNFPVTTLRFPNNTYFSGGWQHAIPFLIQFDYIWMLNSDVTHVSLEKMLSLYNIALYLDADIVSPAFNSPHAHMQPQKGLTPRRVSWIDWTAPFVKVDWWLNMGGFDTDFKGYGADLDICRRGREIGKSAFFVADNIVIHHVGSVTAFNEGLIGVQNNLSEMNRLLKEKWGVNDWTEMI